MDSLFSESKVEPFCFTNSYSTVDMGSGYSHGCWSVVIGCHLWQMSFFCSQMSIESLFIFILPRRHCLYHYHLLFCPWRLSCLTPSSPGANPVCLAGSATAQPWEPPARGSGLALPSQGGETASAMSHLLRRPFFHLQLEGWDNINLQVPICSSTPGFYMQGSLAQYLYTS